MVRIALLDVAGIKADASAPAGLTLTPVSPPQLVENAPFDVVVTGGLRRRKVTSHPTFLWVDHPLDDYLATADAFSNACAFDGYLCPDRAAARLFDRLALSLDRPLTTPLIAADPVAGARAALTAFEAAHASYVAPFAETDIDVIMRTGGRGAATVQRAVSSLAAQSTGRLRLILVRHSPADLDWIRPAGRIAEIQVIEAPGANRGRALAAGLAAVRAPMFAILDDDDLLLRDHFAGLLSAAARSGSRTPFAYSDILRLEDSGKAVAEPLALLREGAAAGPLTAILERLSSHSVLASKAALERVRTAHWDMATGEDSLLMAALLRHSTPVHSPNATAVYSQGHGADSGFIEHPERRADELALHAETFAWRAEIESRFPAKAPDPLEYLRPALRRLEAQAEGRRDARVVAAAAEPPPDPVLQGSAFHAGAFGGDEAVFVRLPLGAGRATGASLHFEPPPGGVQIGPQQPWEIGLRIDILDHALAGCSTWAVATLKGEGPAAGLGVLDAGDTLIERTAIADTAIAVAAEVRGSARAPAPAVIVQAGPAGAAFLRLAELRLGFQREHALAALGLPADTAFAELSEALMQHFGRQVEGRPDPVPSTRTPLGVDAGVFRHADSEAGAGALARGTTGPKAWDYFAQIPVPTAGEAPGWLHLELGPTREGFSLFLVDHGFTGRLSPAIEVRADKQAVEAWLPAPAEEAWLVFQAGAEPQDTPVSIRSLERAW